MPSTKTVLAAAGGVAVAAIVAGAAIAKAATTTPTPGATSSATSSAQSSAGTAIANGESGRGDHGGRGGTHTPATTAETSAVTAAVKAKNPAVTVTSVQKDADGSFDVVGTASGAPVRYDVSKDLATVTAASGHGDHGGGGSHTPATAAELTKLTAAVKAKDPAVTVTSARKDADGSFDVFGSSAGSSVRYEVSGDYATVTLDAH